MANGKLKDSDLVNLAVGGGRDVTIRNNASNGRVEVNQKSVNRQAAFLSKAEIARLVNAFVNDRGANDTEDAVKTILNTLTGRDDRRGQMPVSWRPAMMNPLAKYSYALKDDGERCKLVIWKGLVLLAREGPVVQTREGPVSQLDISVVGLRELRERTREMNLVILDGELMGALTGKDTVDLAFIASTCLCYDGDTSISDGPFISRWKSAVQIVKRLTPRGGPSPAPSFFIVAKPVWESEAKFVSAMRSGTFISSDNTSLFWTRQNNASLVTAVDGIMIYKTLGRCNDEASLMKIKLHRHMTIDFEVGSPKNGSDVVSLLASQKKKYRVLAAYTRKSSQTMSLIAGSIYEFRFDEVQAEYIAVRERSEKGWPNSVKTAMDTLADRATDYSRHDYSVFYEHLLKFAATHE